MKVLVTGAAGFIGSNLLYYLADKEPDWDLYALDSLTYAGNLENIATLIDAKKAVFIRADIADRDEVDRAFGEHNFDLVFHLAAESHVDRSIHSALEFVRANVLGTQCLLDAARDAGSRRFVHISTDEVYGSLGETGRFYETTILDPSSPYSASKAASDLMVLACNKTHGIDAIVTRCTNNYGPYQFPEKFIPLFLTNALEGKNLPLYGDGMNVRSWLYVADHCEALLAVAKRGRAGEIYNIGGISEAEIPNLVVAKKVLSILKKPESLITFVKDRPGHDRRYAVSIEKIEQELGWRPRTDFSRGIEMTVTWYLENESWWRSIKSGEYVKYYERNYAGR